MSKGRNYGQGATDSGPLLAGTEQSNLARGRYQQY
jgi:hypothetical protein